MSGDDIIDAEWEEVPEPESSRAATRSGQGSNLHRVAPASPSIDDDDVSAWRSKAFWYDLGKAILIGSRRTTLTVFGVVVVGFCVLVWAGVIDGTGSETVAGGSSPQLGAQNDAEQMLRGWTKVITGRDDATGFAMINGSGEPGDFCNNAGGDTLLRFGGMAVDGGAKVPVFDFFAEFHGGTQAGVIGAFWYGASEGTLLTRDTAKITDDGTKGEGVVDAVHRFDADGEGRATIDGTAYHVCTL